ncbi:MAG: hypothetical protein IPK31_01885 [Chitinophagaceae bacterium]|nr:hypothetical protein [Chitinophagaceae bacterium]
MKIQDLLPQYLYQQKKLTLPGLGTFELNSAINVYELKEEGWPENTITFSQDRSAVLSDELLAYVVQHTGKMKPLAISDLESHLSNGVQMLNIGKPLPLKGIGSLSKLNNGDLVFHQGTPALEKIDSINTDHVKDRTAEQDEINEIDFTSAPEKSSKKVIIILASVLAVALIAWAVYLAIPKKQTAAVTEQDETTQQDTIAATPPAITDTTAAKPDTAISRKPDSIVVAPAPVTVAPSGTFQLVIQQYKSKALAQQKI